MQEGFGQQYTTGNVAATATVAIKAIVIPAFGGLLVSGPLLDKNLGQWSRHSSLLCCVTIRTTATSCLSDPSAFGQKSLQHPVQKQETLLRAGQPGNINQHQPLPLQPLPGCLYG